MAERGARLLVIDPLMAFLTRTDASRDQDVRRALHKLARLAARRSCAVVCLRHLTKVGGDKAIYRGGGSIGIVAAARAGLLAAADPDDATSRVLAATKCNLGLPPQPLRFRLESHDGACRITWYGEADYTADDLVRRLSRRELAERAEERTRLQEAVDFLRELLADGAKSVFTCCVLAQAEGISKRTLQRAVKPAGVRKIKRNGATEQMWELDPARQPGE